MKQWKSWICILLTLCWMCLIFHMSAQPASRSTETSLHVGMVVGEILVPDFRAQPFQKQLAFARAIDHPVRKCAHASEYAVLGILTGLSADSLGIRKQKWQKAFSAASVYAMTDEFHQLFVPGRSGQISDVLIDSAGALTGIIVLYGITRINNLRNQG